MPKLKIRRGIEADLPSLEVAEPGFTTDTEKFFIGGLSGNVQFAKQADIDNHAAQLAGIAKKIPDVIYMSEYNIKNRIEDANFDCLPALIQAITDANTLGGKVRIEFPMGEYKFGTASGIPAILGHHIWITGQGEELTKLTFTSGTYFVWGNGTTLFEGGGFDSLTINYDTPDTTSSFLKTTYISNQNYRNLKLFNVCTFLEAGDLANNYKTYAQRFTNVHAAVANQGKPLIKLVNGAGFYWEDGTGGFVSGVNPPVGQNDMTTVIGTDFVLIEGNWDTVRLNNFIERFYRGVYAKADAGKTILNIKIYNALYDYIREKSIDIFANGGTIAGIEIDGKFNSWENHCIHVHSTGFCKEVTLDKSKVVFSGGAGIQFDGNPSLFRITNSPVKGCSRKVVSNGIVIGSTLSDFALENNDVGGDMSSAGITWGTTSGISLLGTNDNYSMRGNKSYRFEITTPSDTAQANSSKKRQCKDNIWTGNEAGFNYAGLKSTGIFTLPTSGTDWFNTTPYDVEIHIWGGTVQSLEKELVTLNTSGSFVLRPGEYFKVYYTAAPTIRYFVRQ